MNQHDDDPPPAEFIPRRHRDRAGPPPPQPQVLSPDNGIESVSDADKTLPTRAEAIHAQTITTIDLLTTHTIQRLDDLIKEIEELKTILLTDNAHVKGYFEHHVTLARTAVAQTDHLTESLRQIREERARQINAVTR